MPEKKHRKFDLATKYWLEKGSGHPTLSAIKPTEFPNTLNANFIFERLIGHHDANRAVIQSIHVKDTQVFNKLKKHILELVKKNEIVDERYSYPQEQDVAALNLEQALEIYDGLLAYFISNLSEQENLGKTYRFSQDNQPETDHTAEQLMLYSLEEEAKFSGYLLKSLDLYNLPRPAETTALYGDGKAPSSNGSETKALDYWLKKREEDQEEMYSADANDLVIRVRDRINPTNNLLYKQPTSLRSGFYGRSSRACPESS